MVKLEKVNKYFNRRKRNEIHIINNTSLEFEEKGLVALLGTSGSGKTTLLNAIGGLDKVNRGKIYINGKKITRRRAYTVDKIRNLNIGYIFQDYKLIDNLSVFENVAMALRMIGVKDKKEVEKRVNYVLESVNMYRYRNRPAKMLSGGERQRVSIARAIVKNPNIVIADEPTGNLDSKNSLEIMNIIKAISKDKLVILVTHEVELAKFYASRIIELQDGKIIKDYKNDAGENLDYRLENKIYLKDFKNIDKIENSNLNVDVYSENKEKIDIKVIVKNGNIYIKSENMKIEVVDENSAVELINDHYKKIDKSIYEQYEYNLDKVIDKKVKPRYSSIYGIFKSIISGFKKIANYSILKKILLIGFFASAMFIMYSISNIAGTTNIEDTDFITRNKNYLQVDMAKISVDDFIKYENLEEIDYILPGDSIVCFKIKFDDYYQTSRYTLELRGSLTSLEAITKEDITKGRMPENEYEIVLDKMVVDSMKNSSSVASHMGLKGEDEILNKKVSIDNMKEFTIVGFVDKESPSIYANKSVFINLLNNSKKSESGMGIFVDRIEETTEDAVYDYNLYLDDITLVKGRMPTGDYEVIVNYSRRYDMKINKTIKTKVNGKELKLVGYYESKTDKQYYLVNNNTVKYNVINNNEGLMIYPKDEAKVMDKFRTEYNLNIINRYETDKQNYINEQKESMISSIIFAGVILVISLIEIYLMVRSSFLSRIKEVGVLRAIGVKKTDIYRMFLGEILAITTCASIPGIILMTYILKAISQASYIGRMYVVNGFTIGLSVLIVYAFNIIVGLMPLFKVIRKTPAKILARHDVE
ncbi:MAG: ABC transporter ATP-binding protein/permease [Bacilli bacterium]|nr:ABC transporter ATP-binding protein/permease [Bacilli bacterium]